MTTVDLHRRRLLAAGFGAGIVGLAPWASITARAGSFEPSSSARIDRVRLLLHSGESSHHAAQHIRHLVEAHMKGASRSPLGYVWFENIISPPDQTVSLPMVPASGIADEINFVARAQKPQSILVEIPHSHMLDLTDWIELSGDGLCNLTFPKRAALRSDLTGRASTAVLFSNRALRLRQCVSAPRRIEHIRTVTGDSCAPVGDQPLSRERRAESWSTPVTMSRRTRQVKNMTIGQRGGVEVQLTHPSAHGGAHAHLTNDSHEVAPIYIYDRIRGINARRYVLAPNSAIDDVLPATWVHPEWRYG